MYKSPFLRGVTNEYLVSLDIFIAALPAIIWSAIVYGARPIAVVLISMICGALFEVIYAIILRKSAKIPTATSKHLPPHDAEDW